MACHILRFNNPYRSPLVHQGNWPWETKMQRGLWSEPQTFRYRFRPIGTQSELRRLSKRRWQLALSYFREFPRPRAARKLTVSNSDYDHKSLCSNRPFYPQKELDIIPQAVKAKSAALKGDFEVPASGCWKVNKMFFRGSLTLQLQMNLKFLTVRSLLYLRFLYKTKMEQCSWGRGKQCTNSMDIESVHVKWIALKGRLWHNSLKSEILFRSNNLRHSSERRVCWNHRPRTVFSGIQSIRRLVFEMWRPWRAGTI